LKKVNRNRVGRRLNVFFPNLGADISDYFNYGFNEITWSLYCEKQRRLRSGMDAPMIPQTPIASAVSNHNHKFFLRTLIFDAERFIS